MTEKAETSRKKIVKFPQADEIKRRMEMVDTPVNTKLADFYMLMAAYEQAEVTDVELILLLSSKIYSFVRAERYPADAVDLLLLYVPDYIDVFVEDKEVAKNISKMYWEILEKRGSLLMRLLGKMFMITNPNGIKSVPSPDLSFLPSSDEVEGLCVGLD